MAVENQGKLRVLFVDDEPAIRVLVQQWLGGRKDCQVEFANCPNLGLERLVNAPFEVVVSDLDMRGMNGREFLERVRQQYPLSARIIWCCSSDQQTLLECAGIAHQFLPKPCPPRALNAALDSIGMIRSLLPDQPTREKISKIKWIPSVPSLYLALVLQSQSEETLVAEIAATVSKDIGMTAQILKIVNSAIFGLTTSSVQEAIQHFGTEKVKYLVLAVGILSQFESEKLGGISLEALWHHSLLTANFAKTLATHESPDRQLAEDAFAAGLLHDLGKFVMAKSYPERYERLAQEAQTRQGEWLTQERDAFGFNHSDVGGYLLGLWGLLPTVVEAVAFHHFPAKSKQTEFTALTAVHVANVLAQTQRPAHDGVPSPQVDLDYLRRIGRSESLPAWRELLNAATSAWESPPQSNAA